MWNSCINDALVLLKDYSGAAGHMDAAEDTATMRHIAR
jgi:hypothetical protein